MHRKVRMSDMQSEISILLYLLACALHDEKPDENFFAGVDICKLFSISQRHLLSAMVYFAIQDTDFLKNADFDIAKKWKELKEKAICKNIMLDVERKQILKELEKKHIWYMPLKGSIVKNFYPHEGMREMADNDIMFDANFQEEVRDLFVQRGYDIEAYAQANHDIYRKQPIYNFEMHTSLFNKIVYEELSDKFDSYYEKLIPDEDTVYGRHLSNEDFYVYIVTHAYKHFSYAGTGLRTLVDFYVVNENIKDKMNWDYVEARLAELGIVDFERISRKLAYHFFEKPEYIDILNITFEEQKVLLEYVNAGVYGTVGKLVAVRVKEFSEDGSSITTKAKTRYLLNRLFPSREWIKENYPLCYKFWVLVPFLVVYRVIRTIIFNKRRIFSEIVLLFQSSDSK